MRSRWSTRRQRWQRRSHRHHSLQMAIAAIVVLSLAVLGVIGVATWTNQRAATPSARTDAPIDLNHDDAVLAVDAEGAHPVYRYSVIPGGAHDRAELADAISRDGVVAEHYRTVSLDRVRAERLTEARQAYVSYRIGDRVYWTKHKVTLPAGEAILTDGVTTIRARCGNCIADTPQLPTANDEPAVAELDTVIPAIPPPLPSLARAPIGVPGLPDQSALLGSDPNRSIGPLLPLLPFGLATAGSAQRRSPGQDAAPPDAAAATEPEHLGYDDIGPGGFIPGGPGGGGPIPNGLIPGGFVPGTLIPQPFPDDTPPIDWDTDVPEQPAPIPEPSTFVLLGSGVAGALWRGLRSKIRR